ncbi:MAG TPA: DUF892 family protein [Opitutaceae bacterium]|nr:DUF892 family protein [Opitutaceae bacterium]
MAGPEELQKLLSSQLNELAGIEAELLKSLPPLCAAAANDHLRELVSTHISETEEHASRLKKAAQALGLQVEPAPSSALRPLLQAATAAVAGQPRSLARDLAIIAAARRIEHLEIVSYSGACGLAKGLGPDSALQVLQKTLHEERQADRLLGETAAEIASGAIHLAPFPAD